MRKSVQSRAKCYSFHTNVYPTKFTGIEPDFSHFEKKAPLTTPPTRGLDVLLRSEVLGSAEYISIYTLEILGVGCIVGLLVEQRENAGNVFVMMTLRLHHPTWIAEFPLQTILLHSVHTVTLSYVLIIILKPDLGSLYNVQGDSKLYCNISESNSGAKNKKTTFTKIISLELYKLLIENILLRFFYQCTIRTKNLFCKFPK